MQKREKPEKSTGYIHSIETMGTVDNGGVRFVLFMQGCAMRCVFCHNPDTWLREGTEVSVDEIKKQVLNYKVFFDKHLSLRGPRYCGKRSVPMLSGLPPHR